MPPPFMHSDDHPAIVVRPMVPPDRAAIGSLIVSSENFNKDEVNCAMELVDVYLDNKDQADYRVAVAVDSTSAVRAYTCWGPVPRVRRGADGVCGK